LLPQAYLLHNAVNFLLNKKYKGAKTNSYGLLIGACLGAFVAGSAGSAAYGLFGAIFGALIFGIVGGIVGMAVSTKLAKCCGYATVDEKDREKSKKLIEPQETTTHNDAEKGEAMKRPPPANVFDAQVVFGKDVPEVGAVPSVAEMQATDVPTSSPPSPPSTPDGVSKDHSLTLVDFDA